MELNTQIKNLVENRYFHDEKSLSRWIYHNNKFSTVKKSKIPCFAIQKIERVFTRLIVDFKKNHSEAEVDDSTLESLKKFENLVHEKVLDYKSKHGKIYLFFCRLFFGSIDKLSQELIDEIKKLQKKHVENPVKKEQPISQSIDNEPKDNVHNSNSLPDIEVDSNLSQDDIYKKLPVTIVNDCSVDLQEPLVNEDLSKQESDNKPFSDDLEDKWQNVQEVALLFKDSEENFFIEKNVDDNSSLVVVNHAEDNIIQLKYTNDELENELQIVQQAGSSHTFTKIEENHLSDENVDNRPPIVEMKDDDSLDVLQDTLVEENLTEENGDNTDPKYTQDDLENDLQNQQTVSHSFTKIEENHLYEKDVDNRPPFIEVKDDLEDVLPNTLVEKKLLEENIDNNTSINVVNDLKNELLSLLPKKINHIEIEEVDFNKAQFEFICSEGESLFVSTEQQKLLAEKSNYYETLFFGGYKESYKKICKLPTISKDDLKEIFEISLGIQEVILLPHRAYELLLKAEEFELPLPACDNVIINHIKIDCDPQNLEDFQNIKDIIQTLPLHYISDQLKEAINDYLVRAYLYYSKIAEIQNECKQACQELIISLDIKNLKLFDLKINDEELSELIKFYPNMQSLSIVNGEISNQGVIEVISNIKHLTSLELTFCNGLTDQAVVDGISKMDRLNHLKLYNLHKLTDQAVIHGISKLKQLKTIVLTNCLITDRSLIEVICEMKQLTILNVSACIKLTDRAVIEGISKLKHLTNLDLGYCSLLTDRAVIEGISKLKHLTNLDLVYCSLLTDGAVIDGISYLEQLTSLNVSCCYNLTDRAVIDGLSNLKQLRKLNLDQCRALTNQALTDGISKLEQLRSLELFCCNNLTDKGVIDGLGKLEHLKDLNLLNCPSITEEIKKVLSPSIPYILYDGHK